MKLIILSMRTLTEKMDFVLEIKENAELVERTIGQASNN